MRKRKDLLLCLLATILMVGGLSFNSCKKDEVEPNPVIVENPLEKEAYFITGKVTSEKNPLADVTVSAGSVSAKTSADGIYQIEVEKKGSFELNFTKEGYISILSKVTIDSKAEKGAIVSVSQTLTKKAEPIHVDPAKESNVAPNNDLTVAIPAGAVKTATDVTITPFVPAADKKSQEAADKAVSSGNGTPVTTSTSMSLSSLNCEPDGLKFEKPVEVKLKAAASAGGVYFTKAKHFINGVEKGAATYDAASTSYIILLDGFSVHEVKVAADLSVTVRNESLFSEVIDNIGKTEPVSKTIAFKVNEGWKITSKSAGVTGDIEAKLVKAVTNTLSGAEGASEIEISRDVAVSGDVKMTASYTQSIVEYAFSVETSAGTELIVVEKQGPVKQSLEKVNGTMKPNHN